MLSKKIRLTFLTITFFIVSTDILLIGANYYSAKDFLYQSLADRGAQLHNSYNATLRQISGFMRQTANYIANDERVGELFQDGRAAVEREGGGTGGPAAARIRMELYNLVARSWEEMSKNDEDRQLHFHLPPDTSFLRVHSPERFGDDLSDIRHSVVTTTMTRQETAGFEVGRLFAGIRGVVPVFFGPEEQDNRQFIGALEAGVSMEFMIDQLKDILSAEFAVFIDWDQAQNIMWPDFLEEHTQTHPVVYNNMLEATTDKADILELLDDPKVENLFGQSKTILSKLDGKPVAVTSFPLRDYSGTIDPNYPPVGTIMVWSPAEREIAAFNHRFRTNLGIALTGLVIVELLLFWGVVSAYRAQTHRAQSLTDGLTGIANRRHFDMRLSEEIARARRRNDVLSVIIFDIDYFKQYNDHHGHLKGDHCLQKVAQTLKNELKRSGDFLARYGGEEFVVILPSMEGKAAVLLAERMRQAIEQLQLPHKARIDNGEVVTICGGVSGARFSPDETMEADLLFLADKALYRAKADGRNRVCYNSGDGAPA